MTDSEAFTPTAISGAPITIADLAWWTTKIATLDWAFAVTYSDGAPHEYISNRTVGMTHDDFVRSARVIHTFGAPQKFYKETRIYLEHDGWKYWTMDRDHRDVNLVNRGRANHIYGVQNMPSTKSSTPTAYDGLATYWDTDYGVTDEERIGFALLLDEVTEGYGKCRTLDLGARTGLALDLKATEAFRLTAVEPSQPMLNELVRKHPLVARVEPMPFAEVRDRRHLAGTRFDLALALAGSGSYLTAEDWAALPDHATGRYVLSVYAEGVAPVTVGVSPMLLCVGREHARTFADVHGGRVDRIGRFEVAVVCPTTRHSRSVGADHRKDAVA